MTFPIYRKTKILKPPVSFIILANMMVSSG